MVMTVSIRRHVESRRPTLAEFVEEHGLTVELWERDLRDGDPRKYWARIVGAGHMQRAGMLGSLTADGATHQIALDALALFLSGTRIAINPTSAERRDVTVPVLSGVGEWVEAEGEVERVR